jgi:hypothetical protein
MSKILTNPFFSRLQLQHTEAQIKQTSVLNTLYSIVYSSLIFKNILSVVQHCSFIKVCN